MANLDSSHNRDENSTGSTEDFEKWIRMATDNKINTQNSWDLALIDYFYDLSLLRDGDGINFQKASATLDGCVKIYSSRVDSAVTETGRLINGLATSKVKSNEDSNDENSEDEFDENEDSDSNEEHVKTVRKSKNTSNKDTLVEFKFIRIKKMDLELYVDPIFKKALTDFDEGGSKSLLLNMLSVNEEQKIVFDTSATTDISKDRKYDKIEDSICNEAELHKEDYMDFDEDDYNDKVININELAEKYFKGSNFESLSICPSLKELESVLNNEVSSSNMLKGLENMPLNEYQSQNQLDYDYDLGDVVGGDDMDGLGDLPVIQENKEENDSRYPGNRTSIFFNDLEEEADDYGNTIRELFREDKTFQTDNDIFLDENVPVSNIPDEDLLAYFDENQRKQWAGPDHWKVQRIKNTYNINAVNEVHKIHQDSDQNNKQSKIRQPKENYVIDFLSEEYPDDSKIFEESDITLLPKKEWSSKTKNILPNDMHFTTKNFIKLFSKDQLINSSFYKVKDMDERIDETLYAQNIGESNKLEPAVNAQDFYNDHDDFGGGLDDGGYDFNEVGASDNQQTPLPVGLSQINTKIHNQSSLNYARVSKKVDVKLLKDNLWLSLNQERSLRESLSDNKEETEGNEVSKEILKFSDVVTGLNSKYDQRTKSEISTSFCFICLLHLANENGFTIMNSESNKDLILQDFKTSLIPN